MILKKKYLFAFMLGVVVILFASFSDNHQGRPTTGFWAMEGTLITHHFMDKNDSLSGPELFELQDDNGLPIWFGRYTFKDVCISGVCKMIRLWMFWDGAGNYLGIQVPEDEPLTKSDHTPFEAEDYVKLDAILRDTSSILRDLKQEDLIIVPDTIDPYLAYEIDGYTAATQPALADVVVKDAVYSCHTLWHTVYGPVQPEIHRILGNNLNDEFLSKILSSNKKELILWGIKSVENHPDFHTCFYPKIIGFINSEDASLANQALMYFRPELLADTTIQLQLIQVMADENTDMSIKYEILWKLIETGNIHPKAVLNLLKLFAEQKIGVGAYNLILRLVTPEHIREYAQIDQLLSKFSEHDNGYIRNLTKRALDEKIKTIPQ